MKQPILKIIGLLRRIKKFVTAFFSSWYGDLVPLTLIVLLSAFVITFYTTGEPFVKSIANPAHYITLVGNILLMTPLSLIIAMSIYALDTSKRWSQNVVGRWLFQIIALGIALSVTAMHVVRLIYLSWLQVDLFEMGYLERDFVVVMGCIILQHAYYKIRKVQKERAALEAKLVPYKEQAAVLAGTQNALLALREEYKEAENHLAYSWGILNDIIKEIAVSYNGVDFVKLPVRFLSKVYFKNEGNDKIFYSTTVDGKEVMLEISALSSLERLCPTILMKSTRWELVNLLAVKDLRSTDGKWYLDLFGFGLTEISKDQRERLQANYDRFRQEFEKAKELLCKDRNAND